MKKKLIAFILIFTLIISLTACNETTGPSDSGSGQVSISAPESGYSAISDKVSGNEESEVKSEGSENDISGDGVSENNNGVSSDIETSSLSGISAAPQSSQSSSSSSGSNGETTVELANSVNVSNGTVPMDKSLDFGGKTFTMAITEEGQYHTGEFQRLIAGFSKKFNCRIEVKQIEFGAYNQQVAQSISSGKPYDICFVHGSMFPAGPISNLYADLSSHFTTADYDIGSGGIDIAKSSYFVWKGQLTGVCTSKSVFPYLIYYNKALFRANGLEDPLELYNSGKWTWSKIRSMGKEVTNPEKNIYFLSTQFGYWGTLHTYGTPLISYKNGKAIDNTSTDDIVKGLTLIKAIFTGSNAIAEPQLFNGAMHEAFIAGTTFMTTEESSKYLDISPQVERSVAFNKSKSNLGVVPVPLDSTNEKRSYPTGWLTGICAGKGSSDPRVAVAFAKYFSTYSDPVTDPNAMTKESKELSAGLIAKDIVFLHGNYANSSTATTTLFMNLVGEAATGKDISQSINSIKSQVTDCIKQTMGQ